MILCVCGSFRGAGLALEWKEIRGADFGSLAGLKVGMSFTSAQSQCKGSVD